MFDARLRRPGPLQVLWAVGLLLVSGGALPANSPSKIQALASIQRAVQNFVDAQDFGSTYPASVRLGKLDPRLRLPSCGQDPVVFYANERRKTGNSSLGVRCEGPSRWTIYMPVTIEVFADVLVTARALPRGSQLQANDLRLEKRSLSSLQNGYYLALDQVEDLETKRSLSAATPLSPNHLQARRLVKRGETVRLVAQTGALKVRTNGTALSDGSPGSRIRVKNRNSGRVVEGRVIAPGVVEVTP
jgi:flagella basal body P-ring formation protein FlgA